MRFQRRPRNGRSAHETTVSTASRQRHAWKPRRGTASKPPGRPSSKPDRKRWRGRGETGTLVRRPWSCPAVCHHVTQQAIPLLGACPPKPEMRVQTKIFDQTSWQRGSQKPDRPPADKQRDVSRPDEETAAHGRRASSGGDHGVLGAGSGDCGHSLVAALKTPEPHAFKDWLGGVGAGTAASGRGPSDRHAARGDTRGITIDT